MTKGWHARRAHEEHAVHVHDAGRVEAQRLVELRRVLPGRKEGIIMRCGARCGPGGGMERRRRKRRVHGEGPTKTWGAMARAVSAL
eukprot:scaffold44333_cov59-Phaeocystis_antarctica.AAC.5